MSKIKALIGRDRICQHLEISKNIFYDLLKAGLPVRKIGRRYAGHADEVDEFFKKNPRGLGR